jgi:hypothetical protein
MEVNMWQSTYEKTFPGLKKETIWSLWTDVNNWSRWDADIEYAIMTDSFKRGASFILKPKGGPKVNLHILSSLPLKSFTDLTRFPLAKMYGTHEMEETPKGLKIKNTIRIEGPLSWIWRKIVAEGVAAGMPKQLEALAELASRG